MNPSGPFPSRVFRITSYNVCYTKLLRYVKKDNTLASFTTKPVFSHGESIYVVPPEDIAGSAQKVLIHPLNHYLDDMAVTPVEENTHE